MIVSVAGTPLRVLAIAVATAALVAIFGGGQAVWLCVPGALLAGATCRSIRGGSIGAGLVVAAAAGAALARAGLHPLPSTALIVLVPAASVAVLLSVRNRLEEERDALRASALSDPLTGVANRRSLLERIDYEIARHARNRRSFALLMLDLDGFKLLNDRFGHPAGDDLLRDVAAALAGVIRDQDTLAPRGRGRVLRAGAGNRRRRRPSGSAVASRRPSRGSRPDSTRWGERRRGRVPARRHDGACADGGSRSAAAPRQARHASDPPEAARRLTGATTTRAPA